MVSIFFLVTDRKDIFSKTGLNLKWGFMICLVGLAIYAVAAANRDGLTGEVLRGKTMPNDYLCLCMIGAVAWVIGSFICVYGTKAFSKARFPLLFLVFTIPIPLFILHPVIKTLQYVSAEAANVVFKLSGVPFHREGRLIFELPGLSVKVAEVCSGIRSSLALLILSVITGHMFLRRISHRVILSLMVFPITVVKNALRIGTISLLANYVDMKFLTNHWIHSSGGIPFFAVALCFFIPCVWFLKRSENTKSQKYIHHRDTEYTEKPKTPGIIISSNRRYRGHIRHQLKKLFILPSHQFFMKIDERLIKKNVFSVLSVSLW